MKEDSNKIKSFTDLHAWRESHKLVIIIYEMTRDFPREEIFGLTNQLRRCVISLTSNIAEGFSRQSYKEKVQFYSMALGSLTELQNQLLASKDIGFIDDKTFKSVAEQTVIAHKLISGLIKSSKNHVS
jgi:four helix bundle protein